MNYTFAYQFNLPDHLGNIRAVYDVTSKNIVQKTDYYPFGLAHSVNNMGKNKYLFGGKELQDEVIGGTSFGTLDFGARFYDPLAPHWWTVDPLAEKYYNISPYAYCANNPIRYVDLDGKEIRLHSIVKLDNNGEAVVKRGLSSKMESAMIDIMKTTEGKAFFAQFAKAGDIVGGYTFTEDGTLSKVTLNMWDFSYEAGEKPPYAQSNSGSIDVSEDKNTVTLKVVSSGVNKAEVEETVIHETLVHGFKVADKKRESQPLPSLKIIKR